MFTKIGTQILLEYKKHRTSCLVPIARETDKRMFLFITVSTVDVLFNVKTTEDIKNQYNGSKPVRYVVIVS